jgi:protein TonB
MKSAKAFRFVTLSALVHSGLVLALLMAPQSTPPPEEKETAVEFDTAADLGEQAPAQSPVATTPQVKAAVTAPAPAPTVKTPAPITELPPKKVVADADDSEITEPVVAVVPAPASLNEAAEEETVEAEAEESDVEVPVAEETPQDEPEKALTAEEESTPEDALPEETAPVMAEEPAESPMVAAEEEAAKPEVSESAGEDLASQAEKAPGEEQKAQSPQGQSESQGQAAQGVRSYEDLSQMPGNHPPAYPTQARLQRQQGQVVLQYFVTPGGEVSNMKLVKSSGYASLDQEAIRSISQYKYRPGQQGWTVHPVNFSLKGPEQSMGGRLRTSMNEALRK